MRYTRFCCQRLQSRLDFYASWKMREWRCHYLHLTVNWIIKVYLRGIASEARNYGLATRECFDENWLSERKKRDLRLRLASLIRNVLRPWPASRDLKVNRCSHILNNSTHFGRRWQPTAPWWHWAECQWAMSMRGQCLRWRRRMKL